MRKILTNIAILNYLIIPVAVSINVVGYQLSQILRLPILLDSIGTILAGALCGPIIGILTGALTTCINGIINPIVFAYIGTSMIIGLAAGLLSKQHLLSTIPRVIVSALLLSILTTLCSGIVTFYLFGGATGGTGSLLTASLLALGQKLLTSVLSAQLIQELIDKSLSLLMVYTVLKSLPDRFLIKFENGGGYLNEN
ncbi:hypothetical protein ATZ33_11715 [Enterococcus silesiacus]|nr:ECF transporter S component [Enterococcus silesiacus]ALS02026.1 hypothetical protein ATZ33_11715 [Enterococcus silesiacus]